MIMSSAGLIAKNDSAGEDQQQYARPDQDDYQSEGWQTVCYRGFGETQAYKLVTKLITNFLSAFMVSQLLNSETACLWGTKGQVGVRCVLVDLSKLPAAQTTKLYCVISPEEPDMCFSLKLW